MASGQVATDHFEWRKVKPYLYYVGMFVATIYANMRALQHSNVETIIVFRAVRRTHLPRRPFAWLCPGVFAALPLPPPPPLCRCVATRT